MTDAAPARRTSSRIPSFGASLLPDGGGQFVDNVKLLPSPSTASMFAGVFSSGSLLAADSQADLERNESADTLIGLALSHTSSLPDVTLEVGDNAQPATPLAVGGGVPVGVPGPPAAAAAAVAVASAAGPTAVPVSSHAMGAPVTAGPRGGRAAGVQLSSGSAPVVLSLTLGGSARAPRPADKGARGMMAPASGSKPPPVPVLASSDSAVLPACPDVIQIVSAELKGRPVRSKVRGRAVRVPGPGVLGRSK